VIVFAHGIVGRADLPIPEAMFGAAAAAVLVLSFLALAGLWSRPRLQEWRERRLLPFPVAADVVVGALGVLVFVVTAYAGLAGTENERDNLAPTVVYVALWVGVPFVSLFLGDVWRLISPWRAIGRASGRLMSRVTDPPRRSPTRRARPLAGALGVLGFGICELAGAAREPAPLAVLMLVYLVVMLVGMSLYGVEAWTRNADALGVYFGLFAALAADRTARRRAVRAAARRRRRAIDGRTARRRCCSAAIGVTAFDGAARAAVQRLAPAPAGLLRRPGLPAEHRARARLRRSACSCRRRHRLIWSHRGRGMPRSTADGRARRSCTRSSRSSPPTSSRTTSACSSTTARTCGGWRATARGRLGPVRRRGQHDRLQRHRRDADLVGADLRAGRRPRRRPRAGARPRARPLRESSRRHALPARHAGPDGGLHLPRALAPVGGERMIVFAHAGHWLAQLAYLAPLILLVGLLVAGRLRDRRERRERSDR
jgi:hypothetical protein